jgi:hypothetical protein
MSTSATGRVFAQWLLGLILALGMGSALAEAGHVIYVSGEVNLERATPVPLTKDSVVESGDVITTGDNGRVQLRMANGEFLALRPNTRFVIDEFVMPSIPEEPSTGRSFYSLLKGGFMAITNSFGSRDLNSYRIHTPVATLGIRGSTIGGLLNNNGLMFGVKEGGGSISNSEGIQLVNEGEAAIVPDTFTSPTLIQPAPPALEQIFGDYLPPADVTPPLAESGGGTAAGEQGAAGAGAGEAGGTGLGTGLLILGGVGILAEALSGGGNNNSGTTTTTAPSNGF